MGEMAKIESIEIRLSTSVTPELIEEINPDEVIIAIGAEPIKPNITWKQCTSCYKPHDILAGYSTANGNVVIIGGGLVGLEVAEYLVESADSITVVEMLDQVAKDLGQLRKILCNGKPSYT